MDFFQMIARLIMQNQMGGGGGGWQNPGFGNIPSSPFQFPRYTSPYATGFGSPGGDLMGRPQGGIPNAIPTGQQPLPQRQLGGMGGQIANTGSGNAMLQQYLSSQNPQLAMRPPIDYRNGMRQPASPQDGFVRGIFAR
jgi:hypothetical protein